MKMVVDGASMGAETASKAIIVSAICGNRLRQDYAINEMCPRLG